VIKKTVKIYFTDFAHDFSINDNIIIKNLSANFNIIINPLPDWLFFSSYGNEHLKYDCVKIFYTAENTLPDFNLCDYAIGTHFIDFGDRYLRLPYCVIGEAYKKIITKHYDPGKVLHRKFCNFVYSNSKYADPVRNRFFEKLSEYKKVDAGGLLFNNIGGPVQNKISFIADYKFTIAFENSAVEGYTTEKLVEPMSVNSVPVYWGNPKVGLEFNEESFIILKNPSPGEIDKVIERIKYLDNNDEAYLRLLSEPWLKPGQFREFESALLPFLDHILLQPYPDAFRRARYGYALGYQMTQADLVEVREKYRIHNERYFTHFFKKMIRSVLTKFKNNRF